MLPPLMRDLLVSRNEQITAGPGYPVADDACFNVYRWLHVHISTSESLTERRTLAQLCPRCQAALPCLAARVWLLCSSECPAYRQPQSPLLWSSHQAKPRHAGGQRATPAAPLPDNYALSHGDGQPGPWPA